MKNEEDEKYKIGYQTYKKYYMNNGWINYNNLLQAMLCCLL